MQRCSLDVHRFILHLIVGAPSVARCGQLPRLVACFPDLHRLGGVRRTEPLAPVLRVVAHMIAVVCSAMDGPVLEDARGYRVCRTCRVSECGIVVVVEILLCLISAPQSHSARPTWHASELITPTCPASSVQWVGGSKPVSSPALPAEAPAAAPASSPAAASPAASPAGEDCAGGCAGGEEAGDCSWAGGAGGVAAAASPGGSLLAIVGELRSDDYEALGNEQCWRWNLAQKWESPGDHD